MRRLQSASLALLLLTLLLAGCGDPLIVLGDAPGYVRVVLGKGDSIGTRVDSLASRTRLTEPSAVAVEEATQLLYVADRGALRQVGGINTRVARIFAVTTAGRVRLVLDAGGCASGTCIIEPTALLVAADGTLLVADGAGNRVLRVTPATGAVSVIAGTGQDVASPDGTPALQASLRRPAGLALADDGSLYISEEHGHRVRRIDPAGVLRTVAGNGVATHSGDNGPAAQATILAPAGLAFHAGKLYVAESGAHAVRVIDFATGVIGAVAGTLVAGYRGDGGPAVAASLATPRAVAVSPTGANLYISDRDNRRVRVVNLVSGLISTYAGTGSALFTGSRQPAGETGIGQPAGLAASSHGFLFIADPGHSVVWRSAL